MEKEERKKPPSPLSLYALKRKQRLLQRMKEGTRRKRKPKTIPPQPLTPPPTTLEDNIKKTFDLLDIAPHTDTPNIPPTYTSFIKEYLSYK